MTLLMVNLGIVAVFLYLTILALDVPVASLAKFYSSSGRKLRGPPFKWPIGQLLEKFLDGRSKSLEWLQYGSVYRIHSVFRPEVVISRSCDVKTFLSDARYHVKSKSSNAGWLFHQLIGNCLGLINGQRWSRLRSHFNPIFSHQSIIAGLEVIESEARRFLHALNHSGSSIKMVPASELKMFPFWCTAGLLYGHLTEPERAELLILLEVRSKLFSNIMSSGYYCFPLAKWLNSGLRKKLSRFQEDWENFNYRIYRSRRKSGSEAPIVMLWDEVATDAQTRCEALQTIDEALFANLDVASFTLASCLLLIAHNPSCQARLREEVRHNIDNLKTYCIRNDSYLRLCVMEAMRLHPISAFTMPEESPQTKRFHHHSVPAWTSILIDVHSLYRSKEFWGDDSDSFRPERFHAISQNDLKYHYFPFGHATRVCLGKNLAQAMLGIMISLLVSDYDLRIDRQKMLGDVSGAWDVPTDATIILTTT